jgi:3-methyladenine DNA glycosylase Tag
MRPFAEIEAIAAERHGGIKKLADKLATQQPLTHAQIIATPDDRILSMMTKRVFYSGFSRQIIDRKWPDFEQAFCGFDPEYCAMINEPILDQLLANPAIVRNGAKILSVQKNAQWLLTLAAQHGSAAGFFAEWPDQRYIELITLLRKQGNRLGGETGMRLLRDLGKPAFILTQDVVSALIREQIVYESPSSKADLAKVQHAFNLWSEESGRHLTDISRILAMSVNS